MITAEQARALLDGTTPGPWQAADSWAGENAVLNGDGHAVAVCGADYPETNYFRPSADRLLIAAAPDLAASVIALTERENRIRALPREWRESTQDSVGVVREHWRGQDYVDGQDSGVESCIEELLAALDGP